MVITVELLGLTTSAVVALALSASASAAGTTGIVAASCLDIANEEKLVKQQIVKAIRDAATEGFKPAISLETSASSTATTARVEARANLQATRLASALFAGIRTPASLGSEASKAMFGNSKRRASLDMYSMCASDNALNKVIENQTYYQPIEGQACADHTEPVTMGMNVSQVFQTKMPPAQVKDAFARELLMPSDSVKVTVCTDPGAQINSNACRRDSAVYQEMSAASFEPKTGQDYFLNTQRNFITSNMVNKSTMKITELTICGVKSYLVTGFGNGHNLGFDRSSLIGLIAPIGGKTLVLGDASLQAYHTAASQKTSWPLWFPYYPKDAISSGLGVYNELASLIGSQEEPVNGLLGGDNHLNALRHPDLNRSMVQQ